MKNLIVLVISLLSFSVGSQAAEISLVQGLYQTEKAADDIKTTTISAGARYTLDREEHMAWFGQAILKNIAVDDAPEGASTGGLSYILGGGAYYFLEKFSKRFIPYGTGELNFKKDLRPGSGGSMVEESGLFYAANLGIRMRLGRGFFLDVESQLFESALTGKTKTIAPTGEESEETRTELFAKSDSFFSSTKVAFGMVAPF